MPPRQSTRGRPAAQPGSSTTREDATPPMGGSIAHEMNRMVEAHRSKFSMHPGETKMYQDMKKQF
jgi:hypothetical protein